MAKPIHDKVNACMKYNSCVAIISFMPPLQLKGGGPLAVEGF